jgi:hypothetical protein
MNWLARLKKIDTTPTAEATEPTKPGFVGFVAPGMAPLQKTGADAPAANDAAQVLALVSTGKVSTLVSSPAPVLQDPDRWCWPHSQAMTGREIDTFTARLHHFTRRGLAALDAERLADKLVTRDRETGDRRLCLECTHLAGHAGAWGCRNWQRAEIASKARDAQLPAALVIQLQRCNGFTDQHQQGTAP